MIVRALLAAAMAAVVFGQARAGDDAGLKPPRIEFVGIAPEFIGEGHVRLAFKAINPNDSPLPYVGYLASAFSPPLKDGVIAPLYDIEYRRDGKWKAEPIGWCGTGVGPVELPKKGSATFYVGVPKEDWEATKVAVYWYASQDRKGDPKKAWSADVAQKDLAPPAKDKEKPKAEREADAALAAAFEKTFEKLPRIHRTALELRDAAKAFTDKHNDEAAVSFLKTVARDREFEVGGEGNHLAALIGLALLVEKHDTFPFLKSCTEDEKVAEHLPFVAVKFLPAKMLRGFAETLVQDEKKKWHIRRWGLMLLRAVGDGESLKKLEALKRDDEVSPDEWLVHGRTVKFLKRRLALDAAGQARWSEQLLLMRRIMGTTPSFRGINIAIRWKADKIDAAERNLDSGLLAAMLDVELPPRVGDRAVDNHHDVAVAATLAMMQKKTDLLPALNKLADADWGFVTSHCKTAADALRKEKGKQ